jgi:hypothetical protein
MADDLTSRMRAWEARMAAKKEAERAGAPEPLAVVLPPNARGIVLAAAANILVFPPGMERQYEQHLALTRELKRAGVYPALRVYGLVAEGAAGEARRLLVITGSADETRKLPDAFYTREAEAFIAGQCGGDWGAINPAGSVANLADPGAGVDLRAFEAVLAEIRAGKYYVSIELP